MQATFLIIICLLGAAYAIWTKQGKISLGFFILAVASALNIPNLVGGVWTDILAGLSLVLFALGVLAIVWKKKEEIQEPKNEEK